jgi:SAM-dependent methyltransferase
MWRHRGDDVWCPLCGHRYACFKDAFNRGDAICWRCGSHERHRAIGLLLDARPELLEGRRALLHFAPEYALAFRLERGGHTYTTADIDPEGVDLQLDLTDLALPDDAFDAVVCSHVLEHVGDERAALGELRRITAPGGWCLVLVPLDLGREVTYEDAAITTPEGRLEAFWQPDHVRLYGRDIADRLERAGFDVETVKPEEAFPPETLRHARLNASDWMLICR